MWLGDPLYFLSVVPALGLAIWARLRIGSALRRASKVTVSSGLSGAEAVALVTRSGGDSNTTIAIVPGPLTDFYDSGMDIVRLSADVAEGRSIASIAIAAHETGHALQRARRYPGLRVRNLLAPSASLGAQVCWMLVAASLFLELLSFFFLAVFLFTVNVIVQLAGLPVELNASRRGREAMLAAGVIDESERALLDGALDAAAFRHVAQTLTGVLELLPRLKSSRRSVPRSTSTKA